MIVVIQRVVKASVEINDTVIASIGQGLLVLVGIEAEDNEEDIAWTSNKICGLRIFDDSEGVMNLSVRDIDGDIIAVSQFTLHARTKKGFRPSYIDAAHPDIAIPVYNQFVEQLRNDLGKSIGTGEFGAYMKIQLINDGPVTITMNSKNRK
jgi:D-tyrosyl-tRNA(Tyr) deacylase